MSDLTNQLYRTVALRLFVAWLLLSVLLCGVIYWLETTRLDNFVFASACYAFGTKVNESEKNSSLRKPRKAAKSSCAAFTITGPPQTYT